MRLSNASRILFSTLAGAIAFAALPMSFQALWILRIAENDAAAERDVSILISSAVCFLAVGSVIGLTAAITRMLTLRAAAFGFFVALFAALIVITIQWSEMVGSTTIIANILYYVVPGSCSGVASSVVGRILAS